MSNAIFLDLAQRVEIGTGRDPRLEAEIVCALPRPSYVLSQRPSDNVSGKVISYYESGTHGTGWAPDYTFATDAVLRLIAHELPSASWRMASISPGTINVDVWFGKRLRSGHNASPSRALLAAMLRVLADRT